MAFRKLFMIMLLLVAASAQAATYDFKKNLPPGCSQRGNNPAQCPNGLTLNSGDRIEANKIHEVIVTGDVNLANARVYWGESVRLTIRASGAVNLGYQARVNADIFADGNFSTNSQVTMTGDISARQLYFGYNSNFTGSFSSETTVQTDSQVRLNGPVVATGEVYLGYLSTLNGDVSAARFQTDSQATVTGSVGVTGAIQLANQSTIQGDASGSFIRLLSSGARITGDANSSGDIQLDWQARIDGDATAVNIRNDSGSYNAVGGTPYCQTSNGSQPLQCQSGGSSTNQCDALTHLTDYGVVGLDGFQYGQNSTINGADIVDPNNTGGNTPTPSGVVEDINASFPPLDPAVFPSFSGGSDERNPTNLAPGTYDEIEVRGNGGFASTAGGTYYIDTLSFTNQSNTLQLAPGDYFIRTIEMGNKSSITISPTGTVRIFIEDEIDGGNNLFFNSGGDVENLQILMYPDSEFEIGNFNNASSTLTFNGILYAPYDDVSIEVGNNTNLQGAILTAGDLEIGNNTNISYTDAVRDAVNDAFGCTSETTDIHHYRIQHPLSIVSCLAAPVNVVACLDASCSSRYTDTAEVNLTSSASASSFANAGVLSFSGGEGTIGLSYVDGGTTTIDIANGAPAALNPTQCYDSAGTATTNCEIEYRTAGLIFTANDGVSAIPSAYAGEDFAVLARAVETNTQTGACEARLSGPQVLELAVSCRNPLTCQAGQSFNVNSSSIPLNDAGSPLNYGSLSVTFDANGNAPLTANYTDVGALRLHGRINLDAAPNANEGTIDDPSLTLSGTSVNDFVVRPHTLRVFAVDSANQPVNATTNAGSAFASAGENFSLVVTAENANGDTTPNFGRENPAAEARANYVQTVYPSTATAPASDFVGNQGWTLDSSRIGSLRTDAARWLDVGTIEVAPGLNGNSYLGAGDVAAKQNAPIGRFAPFRFALHNSAVVNSCVAGDFTYLSEPALTVSYELYAVNTDGNITENYDASGYADAAEVAFAAAHLAPADTAADRFADRLISLPSQQNWSAGILSFNTANAGFARHPDNVVDGPYPNLQLGIRVLNELDGRDFAASDLSLTTGAGTAVPLNGTLQLRYGRYALENTYGPENEDLPVQLYAEYYDGTRFVTHTADSCSAAQVAGLSVISDPNNLTPTAAGTDSTLTDGVLPFNTLRWLATGTGTTGEFIFEYDAPTWLEFPWQDEAGNSHAEPRALGGFGQYRGNSRVLFWKEIN
jgi:predicted acyltransferase (DUF342 family)